MDNQSIQHTRWNCTYHIVFIPKYWKRILYGSNKRDIAEKSIQQIEKEQLARLKAKAKAGKLMLDE